MRSCSQLELIVAWPDSKPESATLSPHVSSTSVVTAQRLVTAQHQGLAPSAVADVLAGLGLLGAAHVHLDYLQLICCACA